VTDFERIGGADGLRRVVDDFLGRVFADVMIGFLFDGKNHQRIREMEYRHAAAHLGGPVAYTGRSMREAHARSPIMGGMFMRRRKILENTLRDHAVDADIVDRWLAVVDSLRAEVLGEGVDSAHCDERQQLLKLKRE
jgi:hemoglobin